MLRTLWSVKKILELGKEKGGILIKKALAQKLRFVLPKTLIFVV